MRLPVCGDNLTLRFDSPRMQDSLPLALPIKLAYLLSKYPTLCPTSTAGD